MNRPRRVQLHTSELFRRLRRTAQRSKLVPARMPVQRNNSVRQLVAAPLRIRLSVCRTVAVMVRRALLLPQPLVSEQWPLRLTKAPPPYLQR